MTATRNVKEAVSSSKVLVVGAGGIGCEVLKNLALSGFKDIEIIDLDTIDVSNLNRQFLFRKEHVGKPKAVVARESILSYNPDINIKAYHDSITSQDYGLNFFKKFNIVLNALDNRAARNHVNRMCLAADVPLIESGTSGYSGQVELIKKGVTQCYECQPKPPQKTFPGCTIRNTPSEPVHCIVWAKHLFNQLFGEDDPDQDVSPDTEDPEAKIEGQEHTETETGNVQRASTRQWTQEIKYDPAKLFNKFFKNDIEYLLKMENLWKTRTPPVPLSWEQAASHEGDVAEEENNVKTQDMKVWSLSKCTKVFADTIGVLKEELAEKTFLVWDKDDKPAMDFVTACANIRAHIFSISTKSRFEIKSIAGNIIPAIATANAMIAGLVVLHAFRVLLQDYQKCPSVYLRQKSVHSKFVLAADKQITQANPKCYVCSPQPFVNVFVNTEIMTVKEFETELLKKSLNMVAPDAVLDGKGMVVISSEEGETEVNNDKKLKEIGIVDGSILKCDDFLQNYELTVAINHYEPQEKDDPPYKVVANPDELKAKESVNEMEMTVEAPSLVLDHFSGSAPKKAKSNHFFQIIDLSLGECDKRKSTSTFQSLPSTSNTISNGLCTISKTIPQADIHDIATKTVISPTRELLLPAIKKTKIDQQLTVMIAKGYHPLSLVEEPEFKKLLSLLCPSYTLPTRKVLSEECLPTLYSQLTQKVRNAIADAPGVCLTTDVWTSISNQGLIAITAHYIDTKSVKLCSNLLFCIEYGKSHTSLNLAKSLKDEIIKWNLESKVEIVVNDKAANIVSAVNLAGWECVGCFVHLLNLTVQAAMEHVSEIVQKTKVLMDNAEKNFKTLRSAVLKMKETVSTGWIYTYEMLEGTLRLKNLICQTFDITVNDHPFVSNEFWNVVEKVVTVLKAFVDITAEISSEKTVSLSKIIVYCRLLRRHIQHSIQEFNLCTPVFKLLRTLREQFFKHFSNVEKCEIYTESTILDPRFKGIGFHDEENYKKAFDALKLKIDENAAPNKGFSAAGSSSAVTVSANTSSIWNDFDVEMAFISTPAGAIELQKYVNEPMLVRTGDPIAWWHERKQTYPILYKYVLKRLNLVATSVRCGSMFSKNESIHTEWLPRLSFREMSQLLFINNNWDIYS